MAAEKQYKVTEPTDLADCYVIPAAEVATRTGWSERSLIDDCKAGMIDHVHRKGSYGFTREQLSALIAQYTRKGCGPKKSAAEVAEDELAAARAYNAQAPRRGRSQASSSSSRLSSRDEQMIQVLVNAAPAPTPEQIDTLRRVFARKVQSESPPAAGPGGPQTASKPTD
ncbi:hypothetical protein Vqi01_59010 [Micromonospora qiuiae]|uniref:DNA-binding protein n=1 Tax=Micromonospora qiuiae TaxID=502268 RepID=A0ABQ4JJG3_9ACTN|nr:hypothetical protein [Micromonospora qiuiae]GIJ30739.1 hypothetical protein Vqi01_59010 [Micromonospora qiuiae]